MLRLLRKKVYPIGIDLGSHSLKILQLGWADDGLELIAAAKAEIPEEIHEDPLECHNWYISQIKEMLGSRGFKGKKVVSCLPARSMLIQHLRLPKMKPENIQKNLAYEAQERLPFTVEGAMLRHITAGEVYENDENKLEVILMAASRNAVQEHLHLIEHAKVEIDSVNVEACALVNSFAHLHQDDQQDHAYMLIDLGHTAAKVVIVHGKAIRFCRTINVGVKDICQSVSKQLSIPTSRALSMLTSENFQPDTQVRSSSFASRSDSETAGNPADETTTATLDKTQILQEVTGLTLQKMATEILSCRRYHDLLFENQPVEKVVFVGGLAKNKTFCQHLARLLKLPAQLGDPLARISHQIKVDSDLDEQFNGDWSVAFGLSLGESYTP